MKKYFIANQYIKNPKITYVSKFVYTLRKAEKMFRFDKKVVTIKLLIPADSIKYKQNANTK